MGIPKMALRCFQKTGILIRDGYTKPVKKTSHIPLGTRGFTLVEIAVAIAILGVGLTTLVTIQSRLAEAQLREHNIMRASLIGQYIMSKIEAGETPPDEGKTSKQLLSKLKDVGYLDDESMSKEAIEFEKRQLAHWTLEQTVTPVSIPPLEDALRRIELTIVWGEGGAERHSLIYFAYNKTENKNVSTP